LCGVFHIHTKASDGANTLEEMLSAAESLGYQYVGISDHSESAVYAGGLKSDAVYGQRKEIEQLQKKFSKLHIFHGIEADIHTDGSLDYTTDVLKEFDFVIASIHGQFGLSREQMTKRLCRALENPYTTWIGHISLRLLLGRPAYDFDWETVLDTAQKTGAGIELNANPYRLDVRWDILPEIRKRKIALGIFPDAHSVGGFKDVEFGVMAARKGGLRKQDVINTKSYLEMNSWLKSRR
jgi:DNA polymerase (family 10)